MSSNFVSPAERQRRWRERQTARGVAEVSVLVPSDAVPLIEGLAAALMTESRALHSELEARIRRHLAAAAAAGDSDGASAALAQEAQWYHRTLQALHQRNYDLADELTQTVLSAVGQDPVLRLRPEWSLSPAPAVRPGPVRE